MNRNAVKKSIKDRCDILLYLKKHTAKTPPVTPMRWYPCSVISTTTPVNLEPSNLARSSLSIGTDTIAPNIYRIHSCIKIYKMLIIK